MYDAYNIDKFGKPFMYTRAEGGSQVLTHMTQ